VVGKRLFLHDGEAEITVSQHQFDVAAEWLIRRKWDLQHQFGRAWGQIRSVLYATGFFNGEKPLLLLNSGAGQVAENTCAIGDDEKARSQSAGDRPREIIIRASGPTKPWITWVEIVFIEGSKNSFSVSARTGEAIGGGTAQSPGLGPPIQGRLNWRTVLKFVRSHGLADLSGVPLDEVVISGVQPWQRDVITAAMLRRSSIIPFLSRLSDKELQSLHDRLGGFLSAESLRLLNNLASTTLPVGRRSLAKTAQIVGSPDPMDAGELVADCAAYVDDQRAIRALEQHGDAPAPPEAFLPLLNRRRPRSSQIRARLFELWLRAEPKPTGGNISGMLMNDELPMLYWLLREQAGEVFQVVAESHHEPLREFVCWFLEKAQPYTRYFTGAYEYSSSVVYNFGRPRFAAWVQLAQEVQAAAMSLGISIPENVRLPVMQAYELSSWKFR
jgi:hypothetical protein